MSRFLVLLTALVIIAAHAPASAQSFAGAVTGTLSGGVNKYSGEFTDDLWGAGGFASLQYAPIARLILEARFGLGEYRWKVTPSDIQRYPGYFGQGAEYGDFYPGTTTTLESENESRLTTVDVLVNYVLVDNIPAIPFITAGVGWASFAPSNHEEHDALPNSQAGLYTGSAVSIPLGGGVRIPFSARAGLIMRAEYRFVFSQWLDDVNFEGGNDGITSISVGFTYTFNDPPGPRRHHRHGGGAYYYDDDMDGHHGHHHGMGPDGVDTMAIAPDTAGASGAPPTNPGTMTDTTAEQADTAGQSDMEEQAAAPAKIERCAPGLTRFCVDDDHSVCLDTTFVPGRDRIKWEDGVVYDPDDPGHGKSLKAIGANDPCYSHVVRQVGGAWYHCVDCCFERLKLGDGLIYNLLEEGVIAKGTGTFGPDPCPDCPTVVSEGR